MNRILLCVKKHPRVQLLVFVVSLIIMANVDLTKAEYHRVVSGNYIYLGPGLVINDNNRNVPIRRYGGNDYKLYYSFRAPQSGNITNFKCYLRTGSGYHQGDGGTIQVKIWPSDGETPPRPDITGTAISTGSYAPNFAPPPTIAPLTSCWPAFTLTPNSSVTAGELYFVEIKNIDVDPVNNWCSVNGIAVTDKHAKVMRHQPLYDWFGLHRIGNGEWDLISEEHGWYYGNPYLYDFPSVEYGYSNGTKFGGVRLEPGAALNYEFNLTSSDVIRERINIQENLTIVGVEIHTAASTAGNLTVEIYKNDASMETNTITEDPAEYFESPSKNQNGNFNWYTVNFDSGEYFTVSNGDVVDIKMTAVGSAVFKFACDNTGYTENLGLGIESTFGYSSAQRYYNGQWIDVSYWSYTRDDAFGSGQWRVILITQPTTTSTSLAPPDNLRIVWGE